MEQSHSLMVKASRLCFAIRPSSHALLCVVFFALASKNGHVSDTDFSGWVTKRLFFFMFKANLIGIMNLRLDVNRARELKVTSAGPLHLLAICCLVVDKFTACSDFVIPFRKEESADIKFCRILCLPLHLSNNSCQLKRDKQCVVHAANLENAYSNC